MKQEIGFEHITRDPTSVVTVGTFDGVHRGHQAILQYLVARAQQADGSSTAVSFDPHPRAVVRGEPVPLLSTVAERAEAMAALRLDRFVVLPFTHALAALTAEQFVEEVLHARIGLREIVVGYDFAFGKDREGDADLLARVGERLGFTVQVIPPEVVAEQVVSSSEIRRLLLKEADVQRAAELLGRRYRLQATVVAGDGRGRTIGFPTANLDVLDARKLVPRQGVYAVRVRVPGEAAWQDGMMNIGTRPTFDGTSMRLEVHLLDFDGDLYGQQLQLEFVERLRDERPFASVEALVEQLNVDRARCRERLKAAA